MGEEKQQKKKKKSDSENKDDAKKKEENPSSTTVVLKVDLHYDGCAAKILRYLRSFQGVESVKVKSEVGKLTIMGKVYPSKLKEKLEHKTSKTIDDRISPLPNKNKKVDNNKKPKEPLVTTVVLKVAFHCQGCTERIRKTLFKTKGVHEVAMDKEKEIVTVKGTMEVKTLVGNLMQRLKRKVEVVPPKKEKDNKEDKDKEGVPDKRESGAAAKKKKGGDDNGGYGGDDDAKVKQSGVDFTAPALMPYGPGSSYYGYDYGYNYGPLYMGKVHAPQIFSDENPNACSVM